MSNDFPYSDEQVRQVWESHASSDRSASLAAARRSLELMHEAGITVTFPEPPPYKAVKDEDSFTHIVPSSQRGAYPFAVSVFHGVAGDKADGIVAAVLDYLNGDEGAQGDHPGFITGCECALCRRATAA